MMRFRQFRRSSRRGEMKTLSPDAACPGIGFHHESEKILELRARSDDTSREEMRSE